MRLWEKRGVANSIGRPDKDLTIFSVAAPQSRMAAAFMRIHESAAAKRLAPSDTRGRHSYHEKNGTALHPVQDGSV